MTIEEGIDAKGQIDTHKRDGDVEGQIGSDVEGAIKFSREQLEHLRDMIAWLDPLNPQAFVRELMLWMDNCGGTNKNQYVMGSFAILFALDVLDVMCFSFMLAYRGKFGPDVLAQKVAGSYNSGDTFSEAMLVEHFSRYSFPRVYGGTMLRTWKEGSSRLFHAVAHITSYREFMMIADDGAVDLGKPTTPTAAYAQRYPDDGNFYKGEVLRREAEALKRRSLPGVVKSVLQGNHCGLGAGQISDEPRLFPRTIKTLRIVRLFK